MRTFAHKVGELDPFTRMTARRSAITRVTTKDTAERVSHLGATKIEILPEAGLSHREIAQLSQCPPPDGTRVRFISMGRLLHWKGFHLGLQGFAHAGLKDAEYWILGEGPELANLQSLAEQLGIASQVMFWGRLPRTETLVKLGQAQVLVHPSLHDSGGWVCLEAMAAGRPIICLDLGGPGVQVTEETGIKVPARDREQAIKDLAHAMFCLGNDPKLRLQLGQAGRKMVMEFYNWEVKGYDLIKLYQKIV